MAEVQRHSFGENGVCFNVLWKASVRARMFIFICMLLVEPGRATTHWVVTEDGKIQQQVDSPLNLKHPHHLVLFMQQETRVSYLKKLEKQLVAQKIHIEENEDRDTGLEQRHYKEDADCVTAKVPLGDLDLYDGTFIFLESKGINPEDYVDYMSPLPSDLEKPDCAELLELPYSIHAYHHLRGVQEKVNLTSPLLSKDDPIFESLSHKLGHRMDEVGHRIHQALLRNSSSWVLYNLASFYWRMKNEPRRAVDCVVRALHFSPRQHKDVALINLANILHRAHFSADAAILAHAALDHTTDLFTSHYTLGNIYAMLGEYNHSVLCYEQALQAQSGFEQALRRKHAVLCQQKLEQRLEAQHRSLQRTLNELKEYQKQHDHYLRQQSMLDKHKLIQEEQILRNIIHETQMAKEAQLGELCRPACENGGRCVANEKGDWRCYCWPDFSGERCEINHCTDYCLNGGTCTGSPLGKPTCRCAVGFTGPICERRVCDNYCLNGGTCDVSQGNQPVCRCLAEYTGDRCLYHICHHYCVNSKACTLSGSGHVECVCPARYEGIKCDTDKCLRCHGAPCIIDAETGDVTCNCTSGRIASSCQLCDGYCYNGGTCHLDPDTNLPFCHCTAGFKNQRCDELANPCDYYCQNDGICTITSLNKPRCKCSANWSGTQCERPAPKSSRSDNTPGGSIAIIVPLVLLVILITTVVAGVFICRRQQRGKRVQRQPMTNGGINVEIGNPSYNMYEVEHDNHADAGSFLKPNFTLDPHKPMNYSNPVYAKIYIDGQNCRKPVISIDERRELLPKKLEGTIRETAA